MGVARTLGTSVLRFASPTRFEAQWTAGSRRGGWTGSVDCEEE